MLMNLKEKLFEKDMWKYVPVLSSGTWLGPWWVTLLHSDKECNNRPKK